VAHLSVTRLGKWSKEASGTDEEVLIAEVDFPRT
jgi:hypothetical protein